MIALIEAALGRALPGRGPGSAILIRDGGSGPEDTAMALAFAAGLPLAVAKVARHAPGRERLRGEHLRLLLLEQRLWPHRPHSVPRPLAFEEAGEGAVLVESHLAGRRLKDRPQTLEREPAILDRVVDWLLDFSFACGIERAPTAVALARHVDGPLEQYRSAFRTSPREDAVLGSLAGRLERAFGETLPLVALHGDFADANVLVEKASVAVIDWDEPVEQGLPGLDLFHFLASLALTSAGPGTRPSFERAYAASFLTGGGTADRSRCAWRRYAHRLELPADAALPLFLLAWVRLALLKLAYLEVKRGSVGAGRERALGLERPQADYPVTFFADGRCLNVALAAERSAELQL